MNSNSSLAFVELEMKAAGVLDFAVGLENPSFAAVAKAMGIMGVQATKPEQVAPALQTVLQHPGPALLEVGVNRQELILPPSITKEQVRGFGLFLIKAVLGGRSQEIIDLTKSNWLR